MSSETIAYRRDIGVREWSERQDLHHELLPFRHRKINPVEVARQLRNEFERWPVTKQTWTHEQVAPQPNAIGATRTEDISIPQFLGCYKIDKDACERYTNPNYIHSIPHTPKTKMDQLEHYRFFASLGTFSLSDIAEIYNCTKQSVHGMIESNGYNWRELRRKGQTRFARTMEAIHKWQGIPFSDLSRYFGVNRTTLAEWRNRIERPIPNKPEFKR
jgi:hypothetical protein